MRIIQKVFARSLAAVIKQKVLEPCAFSETNFVNLSLYIEVFLDART